MSRAGSPNTSRVITLAATSDSASDWRHQGACRDADVDPDLFFPIGSTGVHLLQIEEAKAVCRMCPVMEQCAEWALDTRELHGIFGGLTEGERVSILRRRSRDRLKDQDRQQPGPQARPHDNGREMAMHRGAEVVAMVARDGLSHQQAADRLGVHVHIVDTVMRMMVPSAAGSPTRVERVLAREAELRALLGEGLSRRRIAEVLGTEPSVVTQATAILEQRDEARAVVPQVYAGLAVAA